MFETPRHFDDDAWLSFVRGVSGGRQNREMRQHLDRACVECQRAYQTWKQFLEIASRKAPDAASNSAARGTRKALTPPRKGPFPAGRAVLAERVFDSFQDPVPAGIRASAPASRQLLYEAGGYLIDLLLERRSAIKSTLTGQVVQAWTEGASGGAGVVLVRESVVLGQAVANSMGEFQLEFDSENNLKICLGISDGTFIEVPLPDVRPATLPIGGSTT